MKDGLSGGSPGVEANVETGHQWISLLNAFAQSFKQVVASFSFGCCEPPIVNDMAFRNHQPMAITDGISIVEGDCKFVLKNDSLSWQFTEWAGHGLVIIYRCLSGHANLNKAQEVSYTQWVN
jgi:hypothetical protein